MSVRSSHSRAPKTSKFRTINGISYMFTWDTYLDGTKTYAIMRKMEAGKLVAPEGKRLVHLRTDGTVHFGNAGDDLSTDGMYRNLAKKSA